VLFIPILTITGNRGGIPPPPPRGEKFFDFFIVLF